MTPYERLQYRAAINIIDYKIIAKPQPVLDPSKEQMDAITVAVDAMKRRMQETEYPLGRHIAVLEYHLNHPTAFIFKDRNTLDALEQGIMAIRWLMEGNA